MAAAATLSERDASGAFDDVLGTRRGPNVVRMLSDRELMDTVPRATHVVSMPTRESYRPGVGGAVNGYHVCAGHIDSTAAANPFPDEVPTRIRECRDGTVYPTGRPCGPCFWEAKREQDKLRARQQAS